MKAIKAANPLARQSFLKWYHVGSLGQTLQNLEGRYLKASLAQTYNRKTVQVGRLGSESRYIDPDFNGDFVLTDEFGPRSHPNFVQARADDLPFATESIDTLILPHVLEFESDRHQVLREVERVLKPEGRLFVLGLNPFSLNRLTHLTQRNSFWNARLIANQHLLEWLSLLKFDADLDVAFSGASQTMIENPEGAWRELKASLCTAYGIRAIKRSYTLIPIESSWLKVPRLVAGPILENPQLNNVRTHG
jgi:SAM-dependent methyltransferase